MNSVYDDLYMPNQFDPDVSKWPELPSGK